MNELSILVVEDEPSIAEVVGLYLQRAGYQVKTAADGKAAITILEKGIPDLVILDLMLPEIDGLSLTGCQHNDRHIGAVTQPAGQRKTVDLGQHQI